MNFIRTYHQRIILIALGIGGVSMFSVLLNAPVGLLLVSSVAFGGAAFVSFLAQIARPKNSTESRLTAYAFGIFLICLGFCGPVYFLLLILRLFNAQ